MTCIKCGGKTKGYKCVDCGKDSSKHGKHNICKGGYACQNVLDVMNQSLNAVAKN
ncbi:hypothetical protein HYV49_00010 [Candidatus Pacearchaeota archaeon]|nr:hypothetical protein [Candidatus Pacearchaeota archaeon]